jgi:hypothetical protein
MKHAGIFLLLILLAVGLEAQTTPTPTPAPTPAPATTPSPGGAFSLAKPYKDSEFPDWALKLRRFEIIAVGAFPVAYLFSGLGYDYAYYFGNGRPSANIPWPAGPGTSAWTNTDQHDLLQRKNYTLIAVAAGVSLLLATADWALGWGQ